MTHWRVGLLCLAALLAACSSPRPGGYYKDDGPHARVPSNLDATPDAVPRIEALASGANRPYVINGRRYVPDISGRPYRARGIASWYGKKFHGNKTSNGETYDMYAMTAAHPTLPLPSYVRVTRVATGRSVVLRVNDRGPFHEGRIIDLSYVAAHKLGIIAKGSDEVIVERIMPNEIRNGPASGNVGGNAGTAETPVPTPLVSGAVYLQMGAFRESANAQALAARLADSLNNHPATAQVSVLQHPDHLYRVRIGPYATREAALDAAHRLGAQTGITPSLATP